MKCVLAGHGSRGDVEPCAALGRELQRRGHDVLIAVPPNLLDFVESAGLTAVAYGPDSHAQLDGAAAFFGGHVSNPYGALPEIVDRVSRTWLDKGTALASLADEADLIVAGMNEQRLVANVAEYQHLPLIALHFFPSRIQPSGVLRSQLSARCERPLREALGLSEAAEPPPPTLEIQAYDERCLPGQPAQWVEPGKPFAGTLTLQSSTADDDAVTAWIDEGTAPVYFGLGSTPISPPADIIEKLALACARLDERLLVCAGPNDLSRYDRFEHVKFVGAVNHATVFPACKALVHHGGAGTTAAAMRAGVPSLILWLWLDQPVWAAGVEQLKIGVAQSFSEATEDSLMSGLSAIFATDYQRRARNIAEQMMTPHETASCAADLVESVEQA